MVICLERNANDLYGPVDATATPSSLASLKSRRFAAVASYSGLVSDIAIFVLKRDVKLQLTNSYSGQVSS